MNENIHLDYAYLPLRPSQSQRWGVFQIAEIPSHSESQRRKDD